MNSPAIGDIVHYRSHGSRNGEYVSQCRAAVVTEVRGLGRFDGVVGLCVLNPEGIFLNRNIPYSDERAGGTWHWPEQSED